MGFIKILLLPNYFSLRQENLIIGRLDGISQGHFIVLFYNCDCHDNMSYKRMSGREKIIIDLYLDSSKWLYGSLYCYVTSLKGDTCIRIDEPHIIRLFNRLAGYFDS